MIAEVVSVGTELLVGEIVNSNAADIGIRLAACGCDAHYQVVVGDNVERIRQVLATACARSQIVVVTGGVGPTRDDVTRESMCALTGTQMTRDESHARHIHDTVMARRGEVLDSVYRMADHPADCEPLPNREGLALGFVGHHRGATVFVLPGVPREMRAMLDHEVVPRLRAMSEETLISEVIRTAGLGESEIAERLDDLFESHNPTIAFRIAPGEVHVRVSAKGETEAAARRLLSPMAAEVRSRLAEVLVPVTSR